jgi:PAS domain S-box-containing protein
MTGEAAEHRGAFFDNEITELKQWSAELRSLLAMSQTVTAMLPLRETLEHVVTGVRLGLGFDRVGIWLYDEKADYARSVLGTDCAGNVISFGNHSEPVSGSPDSLARVLRGEIPYYLTQDYQAEALPIPNPLMNSVSAHAIVPLRYGTRTIGALTVDNLLSSRPIAERNVESLQLFAGYAAVAIENARLYQEIQEAAARERLINRLLTASRESLNVDDIVTLTVQELGRALNVDRCYVSFWDEMTRSLHIAPRHQYRAREDVYLIPEQVIPEPGNFVIETVCGRGQMMSLPDVTLLPPGPHHAVYERTGARAALYAPIKRHSLIVGMLVLTQVGQVRLWTEEEQRIAQAAAEQLGIALESAFLFRRMQQSEERLRKVIQSAAMCIAIMDCEGRLLLVNHEAERILGCAADEAVGRNFFQLAFPDPGDRAQQVEVFHTALNGGQPVQGHETIVTARDGARRHLLCNVNLLRSPQGNVESVLYVGLDWTERKMLEEQLRQAQKMESLGTLAGGIAHDFNNLLTGVLGYASLALSQMSADDPNHSAITAIEETAQRAANLTQQLLSVSRRVTAEMRPQNFNAVVEAMWQLLRRTIPASIAMELHLSDEPLTVKGSEDQLGQVLMNLCVNARDAMPDGGALRAETRRVRLNEDDCRSLFDATPGDYARLTVADTGTGMSESTLARIFDPFFTTKEVGKGTGLGLAMVYGIVKAHEGFIQVSSQLGWGATFCVYLPLVEEPIVTVPEKKSEPNDAPQQGSETILFVDDEDTVRVLAVNILKMLGYRVLVARDGSEALEVYQQKQAEIDVVLTDLTMPQMSGQELCRALRRLNPQVKLIVSSGYNLGEDDRSIFGEENVRSLPKPYRLREMARVIREVLDGDGVGQ